MLATSLQKVERAGYVHMKVDDRMGTGVLVRGLCRAMKNVTGLDVPNATFDRGSVPNIDMVMDKSSGLLFEEREIRVGVTVRAEKTLS
jgi:hypothetical protein